MTPMGVLMFHNTKPVESMKICFLTYMYPGRHNSSDFAFVKQLVDAIASRGNECYVLSPFNIIHYHRFCPPKESYTVGTGSVVVLRPWYLSFGAKNNFFHRLSGKSHHRAMKRAFSMLPEKLDAVYGHFWHSAFEGYGFAKCKGLPLFVASGESEIVFRRNNDYKSAFCDFVKGVICVSSKNREESISLGLTTADKCLIAPNAINNGLFRKMDKTACRQKLGLPLDAFIVCFVGWFNERKGPLRLAAALNQLTGVHSIFIGKGEQEPKCDNVLFKGSVSHEEVPLYMNASDVFVLPTLHEGCCNAVVEAMACGLPIISSDLPFNWDILNESNSIMIDPNSSDEMARAIELLRDDKDLRTKLSQGAIEKAANLTIEKRAEKIEHFIKERMN